MSDSVRATVNGIPYGLPERPAAVICVDGGDPSYFADGWSRGLLPNIEKMRKSGFHTSAKCVLPSFTNPNNVSIATGSPPSVHGISGNYFIDENTGSEVPMTDPKFLRAPTILAGLSKAGVPVAAITAKDKLRKLLSHEVKDGICFSSEKAASVSMAENGTVDAEALAGMKQPDVYSAELSLFVLKAGAEIIRRGLAKVLYLSLTDYIQHTYAPGSSGSDDFYKRLDDCVGEILSTGAIVGLTADHGMNDKAKADGSPNVIFLQDELDQAFGADSTKVILPITDPYVAHHGSLGGYVRVYCRRGLSVDDVITFVMTLPGIEVALPRDAACAVFDLPPDREGDVTVISDAATAIGSSVSYHDLKALAGHRLRTHGGIAEQTVPFMTSLPLIERYSERARTKKIHNYDIFDFTLNGTLSTQPG
jgi:phosphonoacetate hydrolase